MTKVRRRKLHKNVLVAYSMLRRRGGLLCRQFSVSEEAAHTGGNYIYFTVKYSQKFPTAAALFLIEHGLCISQADGLFEDTPQTFRAVDPDHFEAFKAEYEAPIHV